MSWAKALRRLDLRDLANFKFRSDGPDANNGRIRVNLIRPSGEIHQRNLPTSQKIT